MAEQKNTRTVLYAPDGRRYVAGDRREVTRLRARGYTKKAPVQKQTPKPAEPKPSK